MKTKQELLKSAEFHAERAAEKIDAICPTIKDEQKYEIGMALHELKLAIEYIVDYLKGGEPC